MKALVSSPIGRNLWAIMKKFQLLPNDPRLLSLYQEQIDFILLSMERDVEEEKAALKGNDLGGSVTDTNYSKIDKAERDEDWELMEAGQDPDDIYEQVKEMTKAVDPEFEQHNKQRLQVEQGKVDDRIRNKKEIIAHQQEIIAEAKKRAAHMHAHRSNSKVLKDTDDDIDDDDFLD